MFEEFSPTWNLHTNTNKLARTRKQRRPPKSPVMFCLFCHHDNNTLPPPPQQHQAPTPNCSHGALFDALTLCIELFGFACQHQYFGYWSIISAGSVGFPEFMSRFGMLCLLCIVQFIHSLFNHSVFWYLSEYKANKLVHTLNITFPIFRYRRYTSKNNFTMRIAQSLASRLCHSQKWMAPYARHSQNNTHIAHRYSQPARNHDRVP